MNTTEREFHCTDGSTIPIGTMYCIGRNYAAHARELGNELPEKPLVFLKPPAAYVPDGGSIHLPDFSQNVHHEVELVVVMAKDCEDIPAESTTEYIAGYGVGIDLTLRDVQSVAKQRGEPWAVAKAFRGSAPVSALVPAAAVTADEVFTISLFVNGEERQRAYTNYMERSVSELIAYLSHVFTLRRGDCIFTGTPEGVAQLHPGDRIEAMLEGYVSLNVQVNA